MKTLHIEVPDRLAQELDAFFQAGWFSHEADIVRLALWEFIRRYRLELIERFQHEDIAWALQQKRATD